MGDEAGHRRFRSGVAPHLWDRGLDRRPVFWALQRSGTAERGQGDLRGRIERPRTIEPERGDLQVHDRGLRSDQVVVGDAVLGERPGYPRFVDEVGGGHERIEGLAVGCIVEVENDGPLVAAVRTELQRREVRVVPITQRMLAPSRTSTGGLHLDHIGTQLTEEPGSELPTVIREIEHAHGVERREAPRLVADVVLWHSPSPCGQARR